MSRNTDWILCLSHLRWDFVYQRPQHLLSRAAAERPVVFFEEPIYDVTTPMLELREVNGVTVATPHLGPCGPTEADALQRTMIDRLIFHHDNHRPVMWFYTPMAIGFTQHVRPRAVVYDCMDELSLFQGAPPELKEREAQLLRMADVVFTGGHSLYEHKRSHSQHKNIHPFPSSVDVSHFAQARYGKNEPADQADIPHPRVGFFGVIDERMDLALLGELADARPDLQLVMIGPVVKIDPASLPRRANIHWLGGRTYPQLPAYLSGWDVAMMPFARNDSTRFISPTKTPEYLAAGCPVVSTAIADVVKPYGAEGLAWIANTADEFATAIDEALACDRRALHAHADAFLSDCSWDRTWLDMWTHIEQAITTRAALFTTANFLASESVLRAGD